MLRQVVRKLDSAAGLGVEVGVCVLGILDVSIMFWQTGA